MSLMQMSVSGAIMILAVIVIRALAINRLPKKTFIVLWGIVLLRLLVPFKLPSQFSVYSFMNKHIPAIQGVTELRNTNFLPAPFADLPTAGDVIQGEVATSASFYAIIWGVGLIVCAVFFMVTYYKCRKEFRESLPVKNDFLTKWIAEHKLIRQIEIRQSSRISAPLTYGILKPIILMPKSTKWDDTKQIEYILSHEFIHIKRFDAATKLLLTAALCIHWFNPLVWAMYILSNRDIELSCDETVVHSLGNTTKSAYALTLISMEESKSRLTPLCNNFSKNAIEERITAIMKMKKNSKKAILIGMTLIAVFAIVFTTSPIITEALGIQTNAKAPNLGIEIKDAPVLIKDTNADKISATYDSNHYKVNISQPSSGEWTVDISVVNANTNESVELFVPKQKYDSVDIKISNGMYSGGSFNAASLTASVDNGGLDFSLGENFQGNVNIESSNSVFHLASLDNYTNFNVKMTCDKESMGSATDYFDSDNVN
ncbi:MAG: M56 family metallopeptidase, partial [Brevinema sp.]